MPKTISKTERQQTHQALHQATLALIAQKGLRKVTVDDIAAAVGIGKGSFYTYYPSREVCLFETIRQREEELFNKMEVLMAQGPHSTARYEQILREICLAPDSIIFQLSPVELDALLRKLPPEYHQHMQDKSSDHFARMLALLQVGENKMEAIALLTDCLSITAGNSQYSSRGKGQALDVLVHAIASFLAKEEAT